MNQLKQVYTEALQRLATPEVIAKPLTRELYTRGLIGAWINAYATPLIMEYAASVFERIGDRETAQAAIRAAEAEEGHDDLAYQDLRELGVTLENEQAPQEGVDLVNHFLALSREPRPYGVFGYAFTMEYTSTFINQEHLNHIATFAPGKNIIRARALHSGVGLDVEHTRWSEEVVDRLSEQDAEVAYVAVRKTVPLMMAVIVNA